jgi:hypothetical protein
VELADGRWSRLTFHLGEYEALTWSWDGSVLVFMYNEQAPLPVAAINEPVTLASDYVLCTASVVFGVLLWRRGVRQWALAFFFTAAGSFFGGTFHGYGGEALWKATLYSIGLASLFLLLGVFESTVVRVAALAMFIAYGIWMTTHDDFLYAIVDYGAALVAVTGHQVVAWFRHHAAGAPWVIASAVVSVAAAIAQQAPIPYHNDVYHAIQLAALWLLYRGGTLLSSPRRPV